MQSGLRGARMHWHPFLQAGTHATKVAQCLNITPVSGLKIIPFPAEQTDRVLGSSLTLKLKGFFSVHAVPWGQVA